MTVKGNPRGKPAQLSQGERCVALSLVARYDRRGLSQRAIASKVGDELGRYLSQPTVRTMILQVRKLYDESTETDVHGARAEKLEQFRGARVEAWSAWEESKKDRVVIIEVPNGSGGLKYRRTVVGCLPDNAYMLAVVRALDCECRLLGLYLEEFR